MFPTKMQFEVTALLAVICKLCDSEKVVCFAQALLLSDTQKVIRNV